MRRLLTILVLLVLAAAGIAYVLAEWTSAPAEPAYRLAKIDRGPIVATVTATGTINPTTTVIVGSQLSGQVVEILADFNDEVKAGQVVARLNSDQIRARLDAARADLAQTRAMRLVQEAQIRRVMADIERAKATEADAQAQIARNEALLGDAERQLERQSELRTRGVAAQAAYDTARAQRDAQRAALDSARAQLASAKAQALGLEADLQVARANLEAVRAQVSQREAAVRQIEVDLHNTEIRSPVSGTVVQRNVELGQTVAASLQAPTLFLIADDLRHMEIAANIDETDVGRVKAGQKVSFTVNAYPGRTFDGSVKQVRLGSQTVANVVIYTAIIAVENPKKELLPGMTANLRIETDVRDNVLRVSNAALRWRPPGTEAAAAPRVGGEAAPAERPDGARRERGGALAGFVAAMKAELHLDGAQQKEIDAIVAEMRKSIAVVLRSEEPEAVRRDRIRAAWTATADRIAAILNQQQREAFAALRRRLAEERAERGAMQRGRIYVLGANGKPQAVEVRIGVSDGGVTEIASPALEVGRDVIVGGGPRVAEATATAPRGRRFGF